MFGLKLDKKLQTFFGKDFKSYFNFFSNCIFKYLTSLSTLCNNGMLCFKKVNHCYTQLCKLWVYPESTARITEIVRSSAQPGE